MQIAVCDDIPEELGKILAALDVYKKSHSQLCFDIDSYSTAEDILNAVKKGQIYDIAILDICLPGLPGTDAAEVMLSKNPDMGIIFLTTSNEYAVTAFALNATHYLLKPFSQEQFDTALDRAVCKIENQAFISFACVDGVYRVRISEIVFIESQSHYLSVNLSTGTTLRLRMKLSQMFENLAGYSEIIRIGASYIVNLEFVRKVSGSVVEMLNGAQISVPRRSSESVQKAYMDFCRKEAFR